MKQEQNPAYTMLTNSALSNALALECMIEAYIDEQETELLESAFSIAGDQLEITRNIRDISETEILPDTIQLTARSIGVYIMLSALSDTIDNDDESQRARDLPEAILTMIKAMILVTKTICCHESDQ